MKIFLLGDSFTDNLFKTKYELINRAKTDTKLNYWIERNEIAKYLVGLQSVGVEKAFWFEDWLREWGYEVYNFGRGSCSIEDIIYQFANLKNYEFEDGDRIILNWTHPSRFNWINEDGSVHYIHTHAGQIANEELKMEFQYQTVYRESSFNDGYLNLNLLPFMEYIIKIHKNYKPIVWTPFADVSELLCNMDWHFTFQNQNAFNEFLSKLPSNWTMIHETDGIIDDGHYGRYGNYYLATLFDVIIKSGLDSNYNQNNYVFKQTLDRINSEKMEFVTKF